MRCSIRSPHSGVSVLTVAALCLVVTGSARAEEPGGGISTGASGSPAVIAPASGTDGGARVEPAAAIVRPSSVTARPAAATSPNPPASPPSNAPASGPAATTAPPPEHTPPTPVTPPPPSKAELLARSEFETAQRHYDLGRFEQAVAHYTRAYEAMPLPPLLFNIAQCHRHLREPAQAAFFYRRYLDLAGEPGNAALTKQLLKEMEHRVKDQERLERQKVLTAALAIEAEPEVTVKSGTPLRQRWWVWAVAGGVAVAGAAAVAVVASQPAPGTLGTVNAR